MIERDRDRETERNIEKERRETERHRDRASKETQKATETESIVLHSTT